jgi:hypothetical protein
MLLIPFKPYNLITGTSSLSSDQSLQSGTHPFIYNLKTISVILILPFPVSHFESRHTIYSQGAKGKRLALE